MPHTEAPLADQLERFIEETEVEGCDDCGSLDITVGDELLRSRGSAYLIVQCNQCGKRARRYW